ncbi:unnamed protein product [Brassica oleracea]
MFSVALYHLGFLRLIFFFFFFFKNACCLKCTSITDRVTQLGILFRNKI